MFPRPSYSYVSPKLRELPQPHAHPVYDPVALLSWYRSSYVNDWEVGPGTITVFGATGGKVGRLFVRLVMLPTRS